MEMPPMILVYYMLDELASELGYKNGAQDLVAEECAVNVELLQVVQERLEARLRLNDEIVKAYI
jgi:hypothetical protein